MRRRSETLHKHHIEELWKWALDNKGLPNRPAHIVLALLHLLDELAATTRREPKETTLVGVPPDTWADVQRIAKLMGGE